jgi:D-serine deaminase-like pyridoxal phosphate-dependent protein
MSEWFRIANEEQIASPTVLIYPERVQENIRRMIAMAGDVQKLRPHVKTHKLPQLVQLQISEGINKFKAATIAECEMVAEAGGKDILIAYPIIGPNIQRVIQLIQKYPKAAISCLVDNHVSLQQIALQARQSGVEIPLYIDLNVGMNRTGIAPGNEAIQLYGILSNTPGVRAAGIHAYDGHLHDSDFKVLEQQAIDAFNPVWQMVSAIHAQGLTVPSLVVSGTPTSKILAKRSDVEVSLGTSVLWDFGQPITSPDLDYLNAAVILARVISRPTANRICIDLGHKAVASEMPHPRVKFFGLQDATPVMHNEEHLVLESDNAASYPVGTVLYGLPKHVCPTIALHNEVWCVRDGEAKEAWHVIARDRKITI